jgi:hypothetical protein
MSVLVLFSIGSNVWYKTRILITKLPTLLFLTGVTLQLELSGLEQLNFPVSISSEEQEIKE